MSRWLRACVARASNLARSADCQPVVGYSVHFGYRLSELVLLSVSRFVFRFVSLGFA